MELLIRSATANDAAAMVELLNPIIAAGTFSAMHEPVTITTQQAFLRAAANDGIVLVAVDAARQQLVGMQDVLPAAEENVGAISTFVRIDALRCGIGTRLMNRMLIAAARSGYQHLRAVIRADNTGALAFYARSGFCRIQSQAVARRSHGMAVVMERQLTQ